MLLYKAVTSKILIISITAVFVLVFQATTFLILMFNAEFADQRHLGTITYYSEPPPPLTWRNMNWKELHGIKECSYVFQAKLILMSVPEMYSTFFNFQV